MIVKLSSRSGKKSCYKALADYILAKKEVGAGIEHVRIMNVYPDHDPGLAVHIIEATQTLNTRSKANKTCHLIVAFHPDDQINQTMLEKIENKLVGCIGFGDYQRISVLHKDTAHQHLHIAINKIHPAHHRIHEPFQSQRKLQDMARELELEFGLKQVVGRHKTPEVQQYPNFEQMSGVSSWQRSFDNTLKLQAIDCLSAAANWPEAHKKLALLDVGYVRRGGGAVLKNLKGSGSVKASSLGAEFGFQAMQARLGVFVPGKEISPKKGELANASITEMIPLIASNKSELWQQYQKERAWSFDARRQLGQQKKALTEDILSSWRSRRTKVWHSVFLTYATKRELRAKYKAMQTDLLNKVKQQHAASIRQIKPTLAWSDWLIKQSSLGNAQAIKALRQSCKRSYSETGHVIKGVLAEDWQIAELKYTVGRGGQMLYEIDNQRVLVSGEGVHLPGKMDIGAIAALQTAGELWPRQPLHIKGNSNFCLQVAKTAGVHRLNIRFADAEQERIRITMGEIGDSVTAEGSSAKDFVENWIVRRNALKTKGAKDMLEHVLVPANKPIEGVYKGLRKVGDSQLALIEHNGVMQVQRMFAHQTKICKQTKVGAVFTVYVDDDQGHRR